MYTMDVFNDTKGTTIILLLLLNSCEKRLSVDGKDMLTALEPMLQNIALDFLKPWVSGINIVVFMRNTTKVGLYIIGRKYF